MKKFFLNVLTRTFAIFAVVLLIASCNKEKSSDEKDSASKEKTSSSDKTADIVGKWFSDEASIEGTTEAETWEFFSNGSFYCKDEIKDQQRNLLQKLMFSGTYSFDNDKVSFNVTKDDINITLGQVVDTSNYDVEKVINALLTQLKEGFKVMSIDRSSMTVKGNNGKIINYTRR